MKFLKQKKLLKNKPVHRVVFHEITKTAVNEAVEHPREYFHGFSQCATSATRIGLFSRF